MSLLGAGWLDADPTSGSVGTMSLVTVAVVRDPDHATPLHGTFIGVPSDHLGMEVQVSVTSCDAPGGPHSANQFDRRRDADNECRWNASTFVRLCLRAGASISTRSRVG